MIVGLRNFHKRKDVVPDSNFWCGCPVKNGDSFRGESAFWSLYIQEGGTEDGFFGYRMIYNR